MKRALIVDDEEDIGLIAKVILKKLGVDADDSSRVADAKRKISENHYDLYFLDLNLPDGTGFDLIPFIKAENQVAEIIITSAYDGPKEKQKAKEFGISNFIKKPFSKQDLYKVVDTLTNK